MDHVNRTRETERAHLVLEEDSVMGLYRSFDDPNHSTSVLPGFSHLAKEAFHREIHSSEVVPKSIRESGNLHVNPQIVSESMQRIPNGEETVV